MADHPIFTESLRRIRALLGETGLDPLQQQVLERLVHSSGTPLALLLTPLPASKGWRPCAGGPGAHGHGDGRGGGVATGLRTLGTSVRCLLDWARRSHRRVDAFGGGDALLAAATAAQTAGQPMPLVLGSAPTAVGSSG